MKTVSVIKESLKKLTRFAHERLFRSLAQNSFVGHSEGGKTSHRAHRDENFFFLFDSLQ